MKPLTVKQKWARLAKLVKPARIPQQELDQRWRDWKAGKYDPRTGTRII